jgi:hypothetical protein
MTTSAWEDLATLVSANNTVVTDERDDEHLVLDSVNSIPHCGNKFHRTFL